MTNAIAPNAGHVRPSAAPVAPSAPVFDGRTQRGLGHVPDVPDEPDESETDFDRPNPLDLHVPLQPPAAGVPAAPRRPPPPRTKAVSALPPGPFGSLPPDAFGSMPPQMYQPSAPPKQAPFSPPHPFGDGFKEPELASVSLDLRSLKPQGSAPPEAPVQADYAPLPQSPPVRTGRSMPPALGGVLTRTYDADESAPGQGTPFEGTRAPTLPPLELDRGGWPAPAALGSGSFPGLPPAGPGSPLASPSLPPAGSPETAAPFRSATDLGATGTGPGNVSAVTASAGASGHGQPLLVDVTPRALVVETVGGYCDVVILRNAKIPCERTRRFTTSIDGQTSVRIRVAQGERPRFAQNTLLGEVELVGIQPAPRGVVTIAVTFELDPGGNLKVRATDATSGMQAQALLQLVAVTDDEPSIAGMIERLAAIPVSSLPS